ncbi:MAG: HAD family phosphatase [Endomicrobium sp.]|jgi:beta-phosphoglucomutase|nr:HAD family phosphatase [Endomicrobium sp.]
MINKKTKFRSQGQAVLFDMDGVLVDSMPYHFISWFEVLKKYGVRVTPMDIFGMEGAKWDKVIKFAFKREGKKLDDAIAKKIQKERDLLLKKYFKRYIFPEIPQILKSLKNQGVLIAIVTGSSLAEAKKMLPAKIYKMFDITIAGDMVKRSKPYPDSYLLAAKKLGVKPAECFVIENAPYGIKAAKAAKMYCAAISTSLPKPYLQEADIIFDSHKQLLRAYSHKLRICA